jgi:hypothetical protein
MVSAIVWVVVILILLFIGIAILYYLNTNNYSLTTQVIVGIIILILIIIIGVAAYYSSQSPPPPPPVMLPPMPPPAPATVNVYENPAAIVSAPAAPPPPPPIYPVPVNSAPPPMAYRPQQMSYPGGSGGYIQPGTYYSPSSVDESGLPLQSEEFIVNSNGSAVFDADPIVKTRQVPGSVQRVRAYDSQLGYVTGTLRTPGETITEVEDVAPRNVAIAGGMGGASGQQLAQMLDSPIGNTGYGGYNGGGYGGYAPQGYGGYAPQGYGGYPQAYGTPL